MYIVRNLFSKIQNIIFKLCSHDQKIPLNFCIIFTRLYKNSILELLIEILSNDCVLIY